MITLRKNLKLKVTYSNNIMNKADWLKETLQDRQVPALGMHQI